jgi:hypothetical protein
MRKFKATTAKKNLARKKGLKKLKRKVIARKHLDHKEMLLNHLKHKEQKVWEDYYNSLTGEGVKTNEGLAIS